MSLTDEFGDSYSQELVDRHGKRLLDQYGIEVCEAAGKLDHINITENTARSYKPQVRQVLSACDDLNPTPRDAADAISDADKQSGTKSLAVSAMEKYYRTIEEDERGEELRKIANDEGITDKNFNTEASISGWISKEEVVRIENELLPDKGEKINRLSFADTSWVISAEHKALLMTLFYTGCRVGEICKQDSDDVSLSVEDVRFDANQIRLYRLKKGGEGYKRDVKAVPGKLIDALEDYMSLYNIEDGLIFDFTTRTAQNRIKDIDKLYKHVYGGFENTDKLTPHKFRHGRVTDIANNSSLEDAGQYVDHASPETTNQYRHLGLEEQRDILPEESEPDGSTEELMDKLGVDSMDEAVEKIDEISD